MTKDRDEAEPGSDEDDPEGLVGADSADQVIFSLENMSATHEEKVDSLRLFGSGLASVGSCGICGAELRFDGRRSGLEIRCAGQPQHRWNLVGEFIA